MAQAGTIEKVTSKDGTTIAWEQSGVGPPLVLVHGGTADHTRWAPVLPGLEEHFTVAAVDRRGRGLSGDSEDYSIEREYEDIAAVVDSFVEPVHLLGHSYGAQVALNGALLTGNLRTLTLYEGGGPVEADLFPREAINAVARLIEEGHRDEALVTFMRDIVGVPDEQLKLLRSLPAWKARIKAAHTITREMDELFAHGFDPARVRSIAIPTLLLLGGDSPPFAQREAEALQATIPNSSIAVMPGQQHAAMDTGTDVFLEEVLAFLLDH